MRLRPASTAGAMLRLSCQRSLWSFSSPGQQDLKTLETLANQSPSDPLLQQLVTTKLMEAGEYRRVRIRVESGLFAMNEQTYNTYRNAMAALGKSDLVPSSIASQVLRQTGSNLSLTNSPVPVQVVSANEFLVRLKPNRLQQILSLITVSVVGFFVIKSLSGKGEAGGVMAMLRGTHQLATDVDVRFEDVIGLDEAKHEVQVLVDYLREPEKYIDFGVNMPKVFLLFPLFFF